MNQAIPLQAVPSQYLSVTLSGQNCQLNIYQKFFGLFMDVLIDGAPIINGVLCQNLNPIVRDAYLGFKGDFVFVDTQGTDDPVYTGLGSRFSLAYLEASEL